MKISYIAKTIFSSFLVSLFILGCAPGTPPSAAFSANTRSGTAPLTVSFYDNSLPGSSVITSWLWTFGDGSADSTQQNPQHTYNTPGSYAVSLTVTSTNGVSTTTSPNYIEIFSVSGEGEGEVESVTITLPGGVALEVIDIPAGSFSMGQSDFEIPVHPVTIGYDFQMGKFEVTQSQWLAVMGSFPVAQPIEYPDLPVVNVSWHDCQTFVTALNALGEGYYRLPSEAEWEYCCRAGTTTRWSHGDVETGLDNYAWYNSGVANAQVVGQKLPNPFGLHDMHGNVYEWVQDWYHDNYTGAPTDGSAWVSPVGSKRVLRGGFWNDTAANVRSAYRWALSASDRFSKGGFRLVRLNASGEGEGEGEIVCGFGSEEVLIRDPQLELAIRQSLGVPNACITRNDMLHLTTLIATSYGIIHLEGLEAATNLVNLDLKDNFIEDITPLSNLDKLVELDLSFNGIDEIGPISGLDSLRYLNLACNGFINDWNPLAAVVTTNNGFLEGGTIYVDEDSVLVQNPVSNEDEFTIHFAFVYDSILQYQLQNGVVIELYIGAPGYNGFCDF